MSRTIDPLTTIHPLVTHPLQAVSSQTRSDDTAAASQDATHSAVSKRDGRRVVLNQKQIRVGKFSAPAYDRLASAIEGACHADNACPYRLCGSAILSQIIHRHSPFHRLAPIWLIVGMVNAAASIWSKDHWVLIEESKDRRREGRVCILSARCCPTPPTSALDDQQLILSLSFQPVGRLRAFTL